MVPASDGLNPLFARHLKHPVNPGAITDANGVASVSNPICGDHVFLTVRVRDAVISHARFQASGCSATLAAASAVTELLPGCHLENIPATVTPNRIAELLGGLPPLKWHAAKLVCEAALLLAKSACHPKAHPSTPPS